VARQKVKAKVKVKLEQEKVTLKDKKIISKDNS
jgi:hypothetical protein